MKKKIVTYFAAFVILSALTACGGKTEETNNSNKAIEATITSEPESKLPTTVPTKALQKKEDITTLPTQAPTATSTPTPTFTSTPTPSPTPAVDEEALRRSAAYTLRNEARQDESKNYVYQLGEVYCLYSGEEEEYLAYMGMDTSNYKEEYEQQRTDALLSLLSDYNFGEDILQHFLALAEKYQLLEGYVSNDDIFYCENFDTMCEEFYSQIKINPFKDKIENSFTGISLPNNVLFESDGVTISFNRFEYPSDSGIIKLYFTITNNNEDYKKAYFHLNSIAVNNIKLDESIYIHLSCSEVESGNSVETYCTLYRPLQAYPQYLEQLGTNFKDTVIETVSFDFDTQIGSKSETVKHIVTCPTTLYQTETGPFDNIFGDFQQTITVSNDCKIDIYVATINDKLALTMKYDPSCTFNRKSLHINGQTPNYSVIEFIDATTFILNCTEDEFRRQNEISKSEPLNFVLAIGYNDYTVYTK